MTTPPLASRVALVTGGGMGIGRWEALHLARAGARVVVNDLGVRDADAAHRVVAEIVAAGGEAIADTHDVAESDAARAMVNSAVERFGRIDIVVNNAGMGVRGRLETLDDAAWAQVIAVNLTGHFNVVRSALPHLRAQRSGVIVNTSSDSGTGAFGGAAYAAAKEAIIGFTRALAWEVARDDILCVAIRPRAFDGTLPMPDKFAQFQAFEQRTGVPMVGTHPFAQNCFPRGEEVGRVVAWLARGEAMALNGRVLQVGGGEIGLWAEPAVERSLLRAEEWDAAALDAALPLLMAGVRDPRAALNNADWREMTTRRVTRANPAGDQA